MKNAILFSFSMFAFALGSVASAKTLKCSATYKINSVVQNETLMADEPVVNDLDLLGLYDAYSAVTTKDGRFQIQYWGFQDKSKPELVRASIAIYDTVTKSGTQAGNPSVDSPASPRVDLLYVFDSAAMKGNPANAISAHCDIL